MSNKLPKEQLESLLPAFAPLTEIISRGHIPSRDSLKTILIPFGIDNEVWALDELEVWSKLLQQLSSSPDAEESITVLSMLKDRGIPEFPASLAVDMMANMSGNKVDHESIQLKEEGIKPSFQLLVEPTSLDFGYLNPGQHAQNNIKVTGGPGKVIVRNDRIRVTPMEFGAEATVLQISVIGSNAGQLLWDAISLKNDENEIDVTVIARWVEESPKSDSARSATTIHEKGMLAVICPNPNCKHQNDPELVYCEKCVTTLYPGSKDCFQCKQEIPVNAKYCGLCGYKQ